MTATSYARWKRWLPPLFVLGATLLLFLPALNNGFVNWDDDQNLVNNPHFRGLGLPQLRWMWTNHLLGHFTPITWMSFGLDYVVWGMDPFGYHLTSVLLHVANAGLFYLLALVLLRLTVRDAREEEDWGPVVGAVFASLFFALHPLRVESVAWATERRDVLSGFFSLLATLAYLRAARKERGRMEYLACFGCFVLAVLSKEMAITLPAVFAILDVYPLGRLKGGPGRWFAPPFRGVWLEKVPFVLVSLAASAVIVRQGSGAGSLVAFARLGWMGRLTISLYGLGFYIRKTVAPLQLSPLYWRLDPAGWPFLVSLMIVITVAAIAVIYRSKYPGILAVGLAYVIILLPVIGVVQNGRQVAADRYTYISCLGWALLAGALVQALWRSGRPATRLAVLSGAILLLGGLSALTLLQTQVWTDSETLWTHVIASEPAPVAYQNLGMAVAARGDYFGAMETLKQGLLLDPNDAEIHGDLASVLLAAGRVNEAGAEFREALRRNPRLASSHHGLSRVLLLQGNRDAAIGELRTVLRLEPDNDLARQDLEKSGR